MDHEIVSLAGICCDNYCYGTLLHSQDKDYAFDTGVQTNESHNTENVTTTSLDAKQIDLISDLWSDYDGFRIRRERRPHRRNISVFVGFEQKTAPTLNLQRSTLRSQRGFLETYVQSCTGTSMINSSATSPQMELHARGQSLQIGPNTSNANTDKDETYGRFSMIQERQIAFPLLIHPVDPQIHHTQRVVARFAQPSLYIAIHKYCAWLRYTDVICP